MIATTTISAGSTIQIRDRIKYAKEGLRREIVMKDEQHHAILVCLTGGTCLCSHTSFEEGLIIVIEGEGIFILEGREIPLEPGVIIAMPAHAVHSVSATTNLALLKVIDCHDTWQEHH